jgi:hypothetical protein
MLDSLEVRPICRDERPLWDQLMRQYHYLGFRSLVGESLRYVALVNGQWVAVLGWSAAALTCKVRDRWIGWLPWLQHQRLALVANNSRFLILPTVHIPNLASRVLAYNVKRLSEDWQRRYGHPIWLAETFVDPRYFEGTCYKAAGWIFLGTTQGFAKCSHCYRRHNHPKMVFVRPLHPRARTKLADPSLSSPSSAQPKPLQLSEKQAGELLEQLMKIPDPRMARGIRHRKLSVVAISICAIMCNARSFKAIAEWAERCSQTMLRRLGCRYNKRTKRFDPPSEPTIRRFLQKVDAEAVDGALCGWLQSLTARESAIAVDGKTLKGARQSNGRRVQLLAAFLHQQGIVMAQRSVATKTNEITTVPALLDPLDLGGRVVTLDAMHAQKETARYLVEKKRAHYLFTVKDNQQTLKEDIEALHMSDFPPSAPNGR